MATEVHPEHGGTGAFEDTTEAVDMVIEVQVQGFDDPSWPANRVPVEIRDEQRVIVAITLGHRSGIH